MLLKPGRLAQAAVAAALVVLAGCAVPAGDSAADAVTTEAIPASTAVASVPASGETASSAFPVVAEMLAEEEGISGTIARVVDGDTVYTLDGVKIRIIGYDTPEHGECGFDEAKELVTALVLDKTVTLVNPSSVVDQDRHGRSLRYVEFDQGDLGIAVLEAGLAHARYDGQDGYDPHPLQDTYRALDRETPHVCGE